MHAKPAILSDLHHEVRGSGPPVLFVTGASGDAGQFTRAAELLADELTTVAYDRRGCSRSAPFPDDGPMSISAQADDAAALIEALGLAPAVVFGTSGGGDIVLELVARRPDVVRGAVLHEPALLALADGPPPGDNPIASIAARSADDPRGAMEAFMRMSAGDATFDGLDPALRERILANGVGFFARQLSAFNSYRPDLERIAATGVPVRLFVGEDGFPPLVQTTERIGAALGVPVGRMSGNHTPYAQQPDTFAREVRPILLELCR